MARQRFELTWVTEEGGLLDSDAIEEILERDGVSLKLSDIVRFAKPLGLRRRHNAPRQAAAGAVVELEADTLHEQIRPSLTALASPFMS